MRVDVARQSRQARILEIVDQIGKGGAGDIVPGIRRNFEDEVTS